MKLIRIKLENSREWSSVWWCRTPPSEPILPATKFPTITHHEHHFSRFLALVPIFYSVYFRWHRLCSTLYSHCIIYLHVDEEMEILRLQLSLTELGYIRESQDLEIMKTSVMVSSAEREKRISEYEKLMKKGWLSIIVDNTAIKWLSFTFQIDQLIITVPKQLKSFECHLLILSF